MSLVRLTKECRWLKEIHNWVNDEWEFRHTNRSFAKWLKSLFAWLEFKWYTCHSNSFIFGKFRFMHLIYIRKLFGFSVKIRNLIGFLVFFRMQRHFNCKFLNLWVSLRNWIGFPIFQSIEKNRGRLWQIKIFSVVSSFGQEPAFIYICFAIAFINTNFFQRKILRHLLSKLFSVVNF